LAEKPILGLPIDSWVIFIELERPRTIKFEGDLLTLNAMMLCCPSIIIYNGVISRVISPHTEGLPSIISMEIGFFL
jgi:hypothetical protein